MSRLFPKCKRCDNQDTLMTEQNEALCRACEEEVLARQQVPCGHHELIRYVEELDMYSFSRGRSTCKWRSVWCARHCYAQKFYAMGWAKDEWDKLDNDFWNESSPYAIAREVFESAGPRAQWGEKLPPVRFRFSIKGEIWTTPKDVEKVQAILIQMPATLFWIPTRAWQDPVMEEVIEELVLDRPNARVTASVDTGTSMYILDSLRAQGWSLLYTGDNNDPDQLILSKDGETTENVTKGMYRCPKTWNDAKGHCAVCIDGCFSSKRVDVHLKEHQ